MNEDKDEMYHTAGQCEIASTEGPWHQTIEQKQGSFQVEDEEFNLGRWQVYLWSGGFFLIIMIDGYHF